MCVCNVCMYTMCVVHYVCGTVILYVCGTVIIVQLCCMCM